MTLISLKCPHTTFYTEYTYNACKPGVKVAAHKQAVNGSGVRAISRCLGISTKETVCGTKRLFLWYNIAIIANCNKNNDVH